MKRNKTILQGFEWYVKADASHWRFLADKANTIKEAGITGVWLPPAYKGAQGIDDVGYGTYDLYDLGEFDQKGSVPTKYGTKQEYHDLIDTFHYCDVQVYADIVFDHFLGADETEEVEALRFADNNRNKVISQPESILAWTKFTFPNRQQKYNDYTWTWKNFKGVNHDERTGNNAIWGFEGKQWESEVDHDNGNYDYLMGADLDMDYKETVEQLDLWGRWYLEQTHVDGFRIDAVKHIQFSFFIDWLKKRNEEAGRELFAVGEYWNGEVERLENYLDSCGGMMHLFDVPLHFNLFHASSSNGTYDMRKIFDQTLLASRHDWAVTFVDNHDTQQGQSLESWVEEWFKLQAYSLILLRDEGIPCVFYTDLFDVQTGEVKTPIRTIIKARECLAYGSQMDYFDDPDIVGFTRYGDLEHPDSGIAIVLTNAKGGSKRMSVGAMQAGHIFVDCLGNRSEKLVIEEDGRAQFPVNDGSVSIWVNETALSKIK
ncbi:alpha-amylase [Breznakia blatticola]|uniref:Alpha-amylase n=1 Tax=Breznakia blatticola TaxID=1754012 RepID=A0A4R8A6K0_9FIRM|nr:alpha-amylase [Breznakia blatticola]TDW26310.1 alpha-amylase [Breznakia blatticola]